MNKPTGVVVLENGPGGGVLAGSPARLSGICASLGFKNACGSGRAFLTAPKMARLGLSDAKSEVPGWRGMDTATLWAISTEAR
jgi:hypothetical protein